MKKIIKVFLQRCRTIFKKEKKDSPKKVITLQQVKADIASGKCKKIYYSVTTLWWSHDSADLESSTAIGIKFITKRHKWEMQSPKLTRDQKSKISKLYQAFINAKQRAPLDFEGNTLYEITTDDAIKKWITEAESNPDIFGRHGIRAFMKMHHKNCGGISFRTWDEVNFHIDGIPAITNAKIEVPVKRLNPKIVPGRNESCTCGSGKKYKHCHALLNNHKTTHNE